MSEIKIKWYGHSCFEIAYKDSNVILDPYENGSVPGLKLPDQITADAVYCSHQHADHNAAHLIQLTGRKEPFPTKTITVPHDDADGKKRGMCDIRFIKTGNCTTAHLGDIGRLPLQGEYDQLRKADILMIPCGGYFTINASQAYEIISSLQPKLSILMHYRNGWGYDVLADIASIRKVFPALKELDTDTISFDENNIPAGIITMKPAQ